MESQDGQEHEAWVAENYPDPNWKDFYPRHVIPGARFLYFGLHELGLFDKSIRRHKLEATVFDVCIKHGLVAGHWETPGERPRLSDEVERSAYMSAWWAGRDGLNFDPFI